MFSNTLLVFITLFLSAFTAQAVPVDCPPPSVSIKTVTVTATVSTSSSSLSLSGGKDTSKSGSSSSGGKGHSNSGHHNELKGTATSVAASSTTAASDHNKSGNSHGSKGSTTAVASTTTAASSNAGHKNGSGSNSTVLTGSSSTTSAPPAASSSAGNNGTDTSNVKDTSNSTNAGGNPQTSLTLDPAVISVGFEDNGQDVPDAGQVPSLTSSNNFINFCLTVPNLPLTNGKQITTGSCNTAPMGIIVSTANMPSAKFTFPTNFGTIKANTAFTISMAISNMETGFFVNADENYFAAPQQVNGQGQIQGHSHVVVESLSSIDQTTTTDPTKFAFFKGLNSPAQNGILTADVTAGLPAGFYKVSSINTAANHQPVLVPIAQHGSLDDCVYFTVTNDGTPAANSTAAASTSVNAATNSTTGATTSVASAAPAKATTSEGKLVTSTSSATTTTSSVKVKPTL